MVQERGFAAVTAEDAKAAADAGEVGVIPRCTCCTPGHPDEKKGMPFADCVYIYIPDGDTEGWILRVCVNCFYGVKRQFQRKKKMMALKR
jgi:hypothetical protein